MKKITLFLLLSMVFVFSAEAHKYKSGHNSTGITISVQTFYDELSPYGDWVYTSDLGYVWRPYFDHPDAFRPYSSSGNWVNTEYGWTWVSDYNWGWATFHYGRWSFDDYMGWLWVPGYEWAPAWVTWGYYGDYYGWAPMGPNVYAYSTTSWYAPDPWWTFVPRRHFCSNNWYTYIYNRPVQVTNITYITNVYVNNYNNNTNNSWYYGPRVSDVERYTNKKVRRIEVIDSQRADNTGIRSNRLNVYRPEVDSRRKEARPTEYRNAEQMKAGRHVQQTTARSNDPGMNRTRDNRIEASKSIRETEPRTSQAVSNTRPVETKKESRTDPRTSANTEPRINSLNMGSKSDPRTAPKQSGTVINTQSQSRINKVTADIERKPAITENKGSAVNTARNENIGSRQARTSPQVGENVKRPSAKENGSRQKVSATPSREQKSQISTPTERATPVKTEAKQVVKEEVKQAVRKSTNATPGNGSTVKPARR